MIIGVTLPVAVKVFVLDGEPVCVGVIVEVATEATFNSNAPIAHTLLAEAVIVTFQPFAVAATRSPAVPLTIVLCILVHLWVSLPAVTRVIAEVSPNTPLPTTHEFAEVVFTVTARLVPVPVLNTGVPGPDTPL